jgi:hypothetical protein
VLVVAAACSPPSLNREKRQVTLTRRFWVGDPGAARPPFEGLAHAEPRVRVVHAQPPLPVVGPHRHERRLVRVRRTRAEQTAKQLLPEP